MGGGRTRTGEAEEEEEREDPFPTKISKGSFLSVSHHFYAAVLTSPASVFFLSLKLRSSLPSFVTFLLGTVRKTSVPARGRKRILTFFPFPATQHLRLPD